MLIKVGLHPVMKMDELSIALYFSLKRTKFNHGRTGRNYQHKKMAALQLNHKSNTSWFLRYWWENQNQITPTLIPSAIDWGFYESSYWSLYLNLTWLFLSCHIYMIVSIIPIINLRRWIDWEGGRGFLWTITEKWKNNKHGKLVCKTIPKLWSELIRAPFLIA